MHDLPARERIRSFPPGPTITEARSGKAVANTERERDWLKALAVVYNDYDDVSLLYQRHIQLTAVICIWKQGIATHCCR